MRAAKYRSTTTDVVRWVELRHAILCGERTARELAEAFGTTERTIVRVRARLRAQGCRVPEARCAE